MSFKFGSHPPRSLASFGVAGLVAEEGKVYFETLFNTRHIGRVSDLIAARLRKAAPDDLRLRTMLLLTAFEGIRNHPGYDARKDTLKEPLVIECGMDDEKIAVGMAFTLKDPDMVRAEGLAKRVSIRKATNELEVLLVQLDQAADRVVIRYHEASRRMEVVALMALEGGGIEREEIDKRELPEWVPIQDPEQTPRPAKYIALADVEYAELLRDEARIPGSKQAQQRQAIVNGRGAEQEGERVIGGSLDDTGGETRVGGGKQKKDGFFARFRKKAQTSGDDGAFVVQGGAPEDDGSVGVGGGFMDGAEPGGGGGTTSVDKLSKRLGSFEKGQGHSGKGKGGGRDAGSGDGDEVLYDGSSGEEGEYEEDQSVAGKALNPLKKRLRKIAKRNKLLKSLWRFGSGEDLSEGEEAEEAEGGPAGESGEGSGEGQGLQAVAETFVIEGAQESAQQDRGDLVLKSDGSADAESEGNELTLKSTGSGSEDGEEDDAKLLEIRVPPKSDGPTESDKEIERSLRGIEDGAISRTLTRVQLEANDIKKELTSEKAKKWVEGLTTELIGERARIQELAKRMNTAVRQKDHEFKVKESALHEEIKRKNEQLMQKSAALNRAKEQVGQLSKSMERLKALEEEKADEAHANQKYTMTQRMLAHSKEENKQLVKKLDQLRAQVDRLQLQKGSGKGPSMTEFSALQTKYDRAYRQAEEFKRVNQQLLAQVNSEKSKNAAPAKNTGNEELKRRLEAAVKMAAMTKRESERMSNKVSEMQKEEERLRDELARAQDLLKMQRSLRRSRAGGGGGGGSEGGSGGTPPAESA